jgi:hypothetical protein
MKNTVCIILALTLTSCAVMKKHPVVTGAVIGLAGGVVVAVVTHHTCPNTYDGKPYDGTPPCPK